MLVRSTTLAAPLLLELQRAILEREAWLLLRVELPGEARGFYDHAQEHHLDNYPSLAYEEARKIDATVGIQAPDDVHALAGVDPERMARAARGRRDVREQMLKKRWCSTLWPTPANAALAGMALDDFSRFVAGALFLDRPDPVGGWDELRRFQDALIGRLSGAQELRIEAEGTDLRARASPSAPGSTATASATCPPARSSPARTSPRRPGRIRFTIPSSPAGVDVRGVELEFRDGEVMSAHAPSTARSTCSARWRPTTAPAAWARSASARTIGIDRAIGAILFDEKIGGTVHVALGRSYPETGGKNVSALHWDLICDLRAGGRITADGVTIQEDGHFTL